MREISSYERLQIESALSRQAVGVERGAAVYLIPEHPEAKRVYDTAAWPALRENVLNSKPLGTVFDSFSALSTVCDWIARAEVIVADLSPWSPDLTYVLGLCHGLGRCPLLLVEAGTELPFNLGSLRCIEYRREKEGLFDLREDLARALRVFLTAARANQA